MNNAVKQGYDIPKSAMGTPGAPGPCDCPEDPNLRPYGGPIMPSGERVHFWQDAWRPLFTRINPTYIEPEQYSIESYAYYQQAYNAGFMPMPNLVSSSGLFATLPVQYYKGQYSYVNPHAGVFR
jgi:hypothetical protein